MGQVVTDVTIENGRIKVWFGPCCSKDLGSIGALVEATEPDDLEDPWEPTNPGGITYSACGKSWAIVRAVYKIIELAFSARAELPWQTIHYVESQFGYDLDNNWLLMLIGNTTLGGFFGEDYLDVFDAVEQVRIAGRVEDLLADDAAGVPTDALFEAIKGAFKAEIWPEPRWALWDQAINALGRHDMDTIAKLGAITLDENCEPVVPPVTLFENIATGLPWRYVYDFRTSPVEWVPTANAHFDATYGLWGNCINGLENRAVPEANCPFTAVNNGSTLQVVAVLVDMLGAGENIDNSQVHFGTDDTLHIGADQVIAVTGDNPTVQGLHEIVAYVSNPLGSLEESFKVKLYAYHTDAVEHDDVVANSQRIVAVLFAGIGPGPMAAP